MQKEQAVDVAIIGGGCNGTGVARDLAKRGLKVALFERGDLGRGATGNSSGMIHGGPRYLLDDTETTRHACRDSGYIQAIAPHLLFRIPFLLPVPKKNPFGPFGLLLHDVFFDVYDRYTPLKNGIPHARLTPAELSRAEPGLEGDFLGGVALDEWGIDVGRLCVLNARDAAAHGASISTYTSVKGLMRDAEGAISGVYVAPTQGGETRAIVARAVVNCAGAWAEQLLRGEAGSSGVRIRPGKGVHLVYERRLSNFAVIADAIDGRQIFVMPYMNETWIGTTDDDYYGDLDTLTATFDEVSYLREAGMRVLPALKDQRMIGARVGVRNTIHAWGAQEDALSRGYRVINHGPQGAKNLFSLAGGKLASYRVQAEEMSNRVQEHLKMAPKACTTHKDLLPGGQEAPTPEALAEEFKIDPIAARRLLSRHGALTEDVLKVGRESKTGFAVVDAQEPVLECEIRYTLRHEFVGRLGDLMMRTRLAMGADLGATSAVRAAQIFAEERGLDVTDEREALWDLVSRRWHSARAGLAGAQLAQAELFLQQMHGLALSRTSSASRKRA